LPSVSIHLSIDISITVEKPPLETPYSHTKKSFTTPTPVTTVEYQSSPLFTTHIHISRNTTNTVENLNTPQSPSTTTLLTPVHTVEMISPRNMATPGLKLFIKTKPPDFTVENQSPLNHKRHIQIFHTPVPTVDTDTPYTMATPGPPIETPSHTTPLTPEIPVENTLHILSPTASPFIPMQIFKPRRSHKPHKKRLSRIGKTAITTPKQICSVDKSPRKLKLLSPSFPSQPTPVYQSTTIEYPLIDAPPTMILTSTKVRS